MHRLSKLNFVSLVALGIIAQGCFEFREELGSEFRNSGDGFVMQASISGDSSIQEEESADFEAAPVEAPTTRVVETEERDGKTWMCIRDFTKDRTCTAVAYDGLQELTRESQRIPDGEFGCTRALCSTLFEQKFAKIASSYIHEGD